MGRVLLTGATGFVGRQLCPALAAAGFIVRAAVRPGNPAPEGCAEAVTIENVDGQTRWLPALEDVEAVIHLAARAHVVRDSPENARAYLAVNAEGTRSLADASSGAGVRRFVYLSSIKVNGAATSGRPFIAEDEARPDGIYGRSKLIGEQGVREAAAASGMEGAIIRPPLVYGPGVKANFLALMKWVRRGMPLPFGAVQNARSLISIWNLTDFILTLLSSPRRTDGTWMVSDGHDLSTPALIDLIARAMARQPNVVNVPVGVLRSLGACVGQGAAIARLCESLTVDISATSRAFDWVPPVQVEDGIARTVQAYLKAGAL